MKLIRPTALGLLGVVAWATIVHAEPQVFPIGKNLYAYISDNDGSANSTFLVTRQGILVVDTGINAAEAEKLLSAIRKVSDQPVRYIINTHFHPDHQGGNAVVGSQATVISTEYTRQRTLELLKSLPADRQAALRPADETVSDELTIFLDGFPVQVYAPGRGHTAGDLIVYFPEQKAIALGDLFLTRSSPYMDPQGSVKNWIHSLDAVLEKPVGRVVPGHFELASKKELCLFRDYLADLYTQVEAMYRKHETVDQVRAGITIAAEFKDFRQYPQYQATFADNAAVIFSQLQQSPP